VLLVRNLSIHESILQPLCLRATDVTWSIAPVLQWIYEKNGETTM
jgi:hypothetical protein